MAERRLFSIPAGAPFLDTLAQAMIEGVFGPAYDPADPTSLARTTLYLPTRRASRAFAACLAAKLGAKPVLLPRIVPLGDVDEAEVAQVLAGGPDTVLPGAIDPLRRRLMLTRLVSSWGEAANRIHLKLDPAEPSILPSTLAQAWELAGDLADLLDQMQTEAVPVSRLADLDAARFDRIWQLNAEFLGIVGEHWEGALAAHGALDPAEHRNRMLASERDRLLAMADGGPVIAAGSTGSIPATAELLGAIARMKRGAVVLPGLDCELDDAAWRAVAADPAPSHPQAALARLLARLRIDRGSVVTIGTVPEDRAPRADLLRQAMLPASLTDRWRGEVRMGGDQALAGLSVIEASDEREEALAVALALRETLETEGATAALVTPDRGLAERVAVELGRWGIVIDDSAGLPLARWPAGALLLRLLDAAIEGPTPGSLCDLFANPLCRLGLDPALRARGLAALEIGAFRGVAVEPGLAGITAAFAAGESRALDPHAPRPRRILSADDWAAAATVLDALGSALDPLLVAFAAPDCALGPIVRAAREASSRLSADEDGRPCCFAGQDGEALAALFDDCEAAAPELPSCGRPLDARAILAGLASERVVRRAGAAHPRLAIWGLLEARLLSADHIVLGGLIEQTWPPGAETDSFLNRPMRAELGLLPPERRIGQTAHDFVEAAMASRVTLTRPRKAGEAETIPSRFWQRLKTVAAPEAWAGALARGDRLLFYARSLALPMRGERPVPRPSPKPPAELQTLRLSVTDVEALYRDPYQIFARRILWLDALEPMLDEPGAALRGTLLHEIVGAFTDAWPEALPADAEARLLAIGRSRFAAFAQVPEVAAFWWPRFEMAARHYLAWEAERRRDLARIVTERQAKADFALDGGAVLTLTGRADRIEVTRRPSLRIVDFKTGGAPSQKQIDKGYAPQLTLEAALARRAGFPPEIGPMTVDEIAYVLLKHDARSWQRKPLKFDAPLEEVAETHLQKLLDHVVALRSGREGYVSRRAPEKAGRGGRYDHLARVKEWSAYAGEAEEGE